MTGLEIVLEYLPVEIKKRVPIRTGPKSTPILQIEEIRLRSNKPLALKIGQDMQMVDYIVSQ